MNTQTATPEMSVAFVRAADVVGRIAAGRNADFVAGRLAATRAVRALAESSARPVIERAACGRPIGRPGDQWVELAIAHLDGHAAAVATMAGCATGIGLVRVDSVSVDERHFFLSAREQRAARMCNPSVLWALKEAAWKALSATSDVRFRDLELEVSIDARVSAVHFNGASRPAGSLICAPWPEYRAAIVWLPEVA